MMMMMMMNVDTSGEHSCRWDCWWQHQADTWSSLDHHPTLSGLFPCLNLSVFVYCQHYSK